MTTELIGFNTHEIWESRPKRLARLVLGLVTALGLVALVWAVEFTPLLVAASQWGSDELVAGTACGAALPPVLGLAWLLGRFPNLAGAGFAAGFAGLFSLVDAVLFPLTLISLLLGPGHVFIGFCAGAAGFAGVLAVLRRSPIEQGRHGVANASGGVGFAGGGVGTGGGFGGFGGGCGGGGDGGGGGC